MLAAIAISGIQLYRLNDMVKASMEDPHTSALTLAENGVELNKEETQVIRLSWDNVAFVRVFDESICFFAKDVRGLVIAVNRGREEQVLAYLKEQNIPVRIIS